MLIHGGKYEYRIIRDVGMGTFGRVVKCEKLSKGAEGGRTGSGNKMPTYRHCRDYDHYSSTSNIANDYNSSVVAIKIVRNVRRYYKSALIEADINERVNREQERQNKDLCARMLDRFDLSGHYCLVFECLGRSLYDYLKMHDYQPFPMYCVRDFSRQLLEALDFIHGFGLIHTDLKPENILLINNEETTYHDYNHSDSTSFCRDHGSTRRGMRDHCVQHVPAATKVKLIDFGGATYDNEKKSSIVNTRQYRAPEVILGWGWSYPSDLWSAGCIIAELYTGELLFGTHDNAEHLALIERSVGPFRRDLLSLSEINRRTPAGAAGSLLVRECFDSRGWHRIRGVLSTRSIEHVRKMVPVESLVLERDRPSGIGRLLRSLLTIDPKQRVTAREALKSPFLTQPG
jgi:serine/threonine protein kinase